MVCADAVWRAFLKPLSACLDPTFLIQDVAKLRSNETGTIGSNPGFYCMHQVIGHSGICCHLDYWRIEVNRWKNMTLEQFATSKPTLEELKLIMDSLALNYVSNTQLVCK